MKIFTEILPLLSDLKTMTRFEITAMLPEGAYVDNHPEMEHDFQYVWNAILAMWEGLEWIHLPVTHIQQSMERVIQFVTSTKVPKMIKCFNVYHGKKLDYHAKNTGKMIVRNCWKELPMPTAVIDRVNVLGRAERSLLVFTDRQGRAIGDYAPTAVEQADVDEDESVVADLYSSIPPAPDVTPGVSSIEEQGSADNIPGVDLADVAVLHEPTGVDMGVPQANTLQVFDDAVFDTDLDGGLDAEPPTLETPAHTPPAGMAARSVRVRKPPEKFIPSMQGNKYEIALLRLLLLLVKVRTRWHLHKCQ